MSKLIGYVKEKALLVRALKEKRMIFLFGKLGVGKSFFLEKTFEETGLYPIYIKPKTKRSLVSELGGSYRTESGVANKIFVFDDIQAFLKYDKRKRRPRKTKKNPKPKDPTIQGFFEKLILESKIPIIFVSDGHGNGRSKDRILRSMAAIHKLCLGLHLQPRPLTNLADILRNEKVISKDYDPAELKEFYDAAGGCPRKMMNLYSGGSLLEREKTVTTRDFIKYACSSRKQEAYKYAMNQPDKDFPLLFFLAWTEYNAHSIYPHDINKAALLQRTVASLDPLKYKGMKSEIYGSIIHLLPKTKPIRSIEFPNIWKIKRKAEEEKEEKEKEYKTKVVVKKTGSKKKTRKSAPTKRRKKKAKPMTKQRSLF